MWFPVRLNSRRTAGSANQPGLICDSMFSSKLRYLRLTKELKAESVISVTPTPLMDRLRTEVRLSLCNTVELICPTSG